MEGALKQTALVLFAGVGLFFFTDSGVLAVDDAYLADKYNEALQKGCRPVIVKRTVVAGPLGLLPGGGLFFTEHYGGAIRDLLLWPLSVLWDPILAVKKAREQNMQATVAACRASETKSTTRK